MNTKFKISKIFLFLTLFLFIRSNTNSEATIEYPMYIPSSCINLNSLVDDPYIILMSNLYTTNKNISSETIQVELCNSKKHTVIESKLCTILIEDDGLLVANCYFDTISSRTIGEYYLKSAGINSSKINIPPFNLSNFPLNMHNNDNIMFERGKKSTNKNFYRYIAYFGVSDSENFDYINFPFNSEFSDSLSIPAVSVLRSGSYEKLTCEISDFGYDAIKCALPKNYLYAHLTGYISTSCGGPTDGFKLEIHKAQTIIRMTSASSSEKCYKDTAEVVFTYEITEGDTDQAIPPKVFANCLKVYSEKTSKLNTNGDEYLVVNCIDNGNNQITCETNADISDGNYHVGILNSCNVDKYTIRSAYFPNVFSKAQDFVTPTNDTMDIRVSYQSKSEYEFTILYDGYVSSSTKIVVNDKELSCTYSGMKATCSFNSTDLRALSPGFTTYVAKIIDACGNEYRDITIKVTNNSIPNYLSIYEINLSKKCFIYQDAYSTVQVNLYYTLDGYSGDISDFTMNLVNIDDDDIKLEANCQNLLGYATPQFQCTVSNGNFQGARPGKYRVVIEEITDSDYTIKDFSSYNTIPLSGNLPINPRYDYTINGVFGPEDTSYYKFSLQFRDKLDDYSKPGILINDNLIACTIYEEKKEYLNCTIYKTQAPYNESSQYYGYYINFCGYQYTAFTFNSAPKPVLTLSNIDYKEQQCYDFDTTLIDFNLYFDKNFGGNDPPVVSAKFVHEENENESFNVDCNRMPGLYYFECTSGYLEREGKKKGRYYLHVEQQEFNDFAVNSYVGNQALLLSKGTGSTVKPIEPLINDTIYILARFKEDYNATCEFKIKFESTLTSENRPDIFINGTTLNCNVDKSDKTAYNCIAYYKDFGFSPGITVDYYGYFIHLCQGTYFPVTLNSGLRLSMTLSNVQYQESCIVFTEDKSLSYLIDYQLSGSISGSEIASFNIKNVNTEDESNYFESICSASGTTFKCVATSASFKGKKGKFLPKLDNELSYTEYSIEIFTASVPFELFNRAPIPEAPIENNTVYIKALFDANDTSSTYYGNISFNDEINDGNMPKIYFGNQQIQCVIDKEYNKNITCEFKKSDFPLGEIEGEDPVYDGKMFDKCGSAYYDISLSSHKKKDDDDDKKKKPSTKLTTKVVAFIVVIMIIVLGIIGFILYRACRRKITETNMNEVLQVEQIN